MKKSKQETPKLATQQEFDRLKKNSVSKGSEQKTAGKSQTATKAENIADLSSARINGANQIQANYKFYSVPDILFSSHRLSDGWVFIPGQTGLANKESGEPMDDPPMITVTLNGIRSIPAFVRFVKNEQAERWNDVALRLRDCQVLQNPTVTFYAGGGQEINDTVKCIVCSSVVPVYGKFACGVAPVLEELYEGIKIKIKADLYEDRSLQLDSKIFVSDVLNKDCIMAVSTGNTFSSDGEKNQSEPESFSVQMRTVENKTIEINRLTVPPETSLLFAFPKMEDFRKPEVIKSNRVRTTYLLISLKIVKTENGGGTGE